MDLLGSSVAGQSASEDGSFEIELAEAASSLEGADAADIVRWATGRFGDGLTLACSFQDVVLVDVATRVDPGIEVLFLDTGFHFPETLAYVEDVRRRYELNLRVLRPALGPDESPCGTDQCCQRRKVEPLNRALAGRSAWMTGLRRADSPLRADTPVVELDQARGVAKINPLAAWTDEEVAAYTTEHDLPVHPLTGKGYASIGCAPTTSPVRVGEHPRSGRWRGMEKTECGLHLPAGEMPAAGGE
ncbi:MAG: phosphoadenylyl-sulfate reductase [Acidimicrobiales bacterium]|nr:phosphoadenylyl-sulfate reductase [Acidimicrobiales bacterium]MBO0893532.1 phosphoadenylyl-sulfate reductase [Acidimicrobiales bacterium]